jgi:hypothetical protein
MPGGWWCPSGSPPSTRPADSLRPPNEEGAAFAGPFVLVAGQDLNLRPLGYESIPTHGGEKTRVFPTASDLRSRLDLVAVVEARGRLASAGGEPWGEARTELLERRFDAEPQ